MPVPLQWNLTLQVLINLFQLTQQAIFGVIDDRGCKDVGHKQ
jgi:hypothetical protein